MFNIYGGKNLCPRQSINEGLCLYSISKLQKHQKKIFFCKCGHSYEKSNDFDKDNNDDDGDGNGSDVDVDKTIKCC